MLYLNPVFKRNTIKKIAMAVVPFVLLYMLVDFLNKNVTPDFILSTITPWGILAPFVFFVFLCSTNIVPPFPVVPFWVVALTLFEKTQAILIIYLANIFGNSANYLISKHLGKPAVKILVGNKGIRKVEELTEEITGFKEFLLIRIFGGGLTDYISYAAGFTRITTKSYMLATLIGLIPVTFIGILMIDTALEIGTAQTFGTLIIFYLLNYLSAIIAPAIIISNRQKNKKEGPKI